MILEKEILLWKNTVGITTDCLEVVKLPQTDFPKLIFQDFMNQLKISKVQIGFETNLAQLIEVEPNGFEMLDDTIRFNLKPNNTINQSTIILYYLLCQVLESKFELLNIYTNNTNKAELFFKSLIPFSNKSEVSLSDSLIKQLTKTLPQKEKQLMIERFFILMGAQYKDKLMLFLTYLDTKYKFKLDKNQFIDMTLNPVKLKRIENHIKLLIL